MSKEDKDIFTNFKIEQHSKMTEADRKAYREKSAEFSKEVSNMLGKISKEDKDIFTNFKIEQHSKMTEADRKAYREKSAEFSKEVSNMLGKISKEDGVDLIPDEPKANAPHNNKPKAAKLPESKISKAISDRENKMSKAKQNKTFTHNKIKPASESTSKNTIFTNNKTLATKIAEIKSQISEIGHSDTTGKQPNKFNEVQHNKNNQSLGK